ncbi:AMP-binding protein, partial [Rhodococcus sp. SJ]|uniref:AMP-binding protein n=1 Tax=Rhodococcus sp. SJ TaxID=3434112 RepID=UPI003D78CFEC
SVWEFFWPLQVGARLVVAEPEVHRDPAQLARVMADLGVTVVHFVPSMLAVFVAEPGAARLPALRYVFASGEALPAQTAARVRALGAAGLHNLYGPTEAAVDVTYHAVTEADRVSVPIGTAVADTDLLVLDDALRPVPDGVVGELYLGGVQLARGYVARPELTAERFVARPASAGGARVYRTGDLVRRRAGDGVLEYIGRTDFQVKVRGLRIELGEIESALLDQPAVDQAAVVVHTDATVGDVLVAYVVGAGPEPVDTEALTRVLARRLPDYMVPATYVVLDEFPLGSSGKLDRKALPAPDLVAHRAEYREPATVIEAAVAAVFADLTGAERVGADDEFFGLGGNSLLATRAVARINAEYGTAVKVGDFFDASTVAAFAGIIDRAVASGTGPARPPLTAGPRPERVPLSLAQQRMWFLNRLDPGSAVDNIPAALRIRGPLDPNALAAAARDVIARHESLRTLYPEIDGVGYQRILHPDAVTIDLVPCAVAEAELPEHVVREVTTGFDVTVDVPLRLRLLRLGGDDHVLVVVLHHIAGDGFSMGPLTRDLLAAYAVRVEGGTPDWAPLEVQYADYAIWQRAVLGDEADPASLMAVQLDYWRRELDSLPTSIDLPTDRPRPAVASGRGAAQRFTIPAAVYRGVRDVAAAHRATEFMVVHAALAVLLARLSSGDDVAVGTPVAGRGEARLDDLVGMFVNTLVLRTQVDPAESFTGLLARVRETDLGAFAHADVPFERLVEVVDPVRSQAHHPLFQVMLTFQNLGHAELDLSGLNVTGVDIGAAAAKVDLQLTVAPVADGDVTAELTYASELFEAASVGVLAERFVRLLGAVVADPGVRVGAVELMSAAERSAVVAASSGAVRGVDAVTLVEVFDERVASVPDAVAVVFGEVSLSYADFDARVNRLARYLISVGVGPESLVALAMRRSVELLVGMYAVVKAGGAYVPVDPDQPAERTEYVLEVADPVVVLTTGECGFGTGRWPVVCVDSVDVSGYSSLPVVDAERVAPLRAQNAAYVIFTSGSTGRPKGVAVSHAAIVNRLVWMQAEYGLSGRDVVLQKTPFTFDVSVWEFFWPLQVGARLVVAEPEVHRDPAQLARVMADLGVTVVHFVPSMLEVFVAEPGAARLPALRLVFASGEALPAQTAARVRALGGAGLHNLYGPTEAAVDVTYHAVTEADRVSVPIG